MILHVYLPEASAAPRQAATWAALPGLAAAGGGRILSVAPPADRPLRYAEALRAAWSAAAAIDEDLVVLEGDKLLAPVQLRGLLACPCLICAQAYRLYPCTTGLPAPIYAQGEDLGAAGVRWLREREAWAGVSGLGVLRLSRRLPDGPRCAGAYGPDFDRRVVGPLVANHGPVHVHWPPAVHDHRGGWAGD